MKSFFQKPGFRLVVVFSIAAATIPLSNAKDALAQDSRKNFRAEYETRIKAAEQKLQKNISDAQSAFLAEVRRAGAELDARLNLESKALEKVRPENRFEKIVSVNGATPAPMQIGTGKMGWFEVPEIMTKAVIFTPAKDQPKDGVVEFTVHKNTRIGLAASWAYDGNSGGGWRAERITRSDLEKMGWVNQGEMYLNVYDRHTLFIRDCEAGEKIRIRTRKYYRPFVFIPNALKQTTLRSSVSSSKKDVVIEVAASKQMDSVEFFGSEKTPKVLIGTDSFTSPLTGVALVKAHRMAKVFVAASWDYDGNSSGQWTEERWTREGFVERGWKPIGTIKIKHRGSLQDHQLFVKVLNQGDHCRIRTRKYGAPYVFAQKPF